MKRIIGEIVYRLAKLFGASPDCLGEIVNEFRLLD